MKRGGQLVWIWAAPLQLWANVSKRFKSKISPQWLAINIFPGGSRWGGYISISSILFALCCRTRWQEKPVMGCSESLCINSTVVEAGWGEWWVEDGGGTMSSSHTLTAASPLRRHACQQPLRSGRDYSSLTSLSVQPYCQTVELSLLAYFETKVYASENISIMLLKVASRWEHSQTNGLACRGAHWGVRSHGHRTPEGRIR